MAEESAGEKTEKPSSRKLGQARSQGQVARSVELSQVMGLLASFIALQQLAPFLWLKLKYLTAASLSSKYSASPLTLQELSVGFFFLLQVLLPIILALLAIAAFFGAGTTLVQTKFLWANKLLRPKFNMLNPISGLKRIFSFNNLFTTAKQMLKLVFIAPVAYSAFVEAFPQLLTLMDLPITHLLPYTALVTANLFWKIFVIFLILAIVDYIWQRYSFTKTLKMTKSEVKDERKAVEGDETTRQRIRARALQRIRQRILEAVKTADVIVTNPTHFAVALKYDLGRHSAPVVVAKGRGFMAETIIRIAREHRVPVIERKPVARALFKAVEVGQAIPYELYAACAEVLAYVYRLRGRNPFHKDNQTNR